MNIWAPLPSDTNTLYIVKVPDPPIGEPIIWSPDPGTRVKVYCGCFAVTTGGLGAVRQARLRLLYGSDIVLTRTCAYNVPFTATIRISVGEFYRTAFSASIFEAEIYWDSSIYLISGMTIELGLTTVEPTDQFHDCVLYTDCWNDMSIRVGDK